MEEMDGYMIQCSLFDQPPPPAAHVLKEYPQKAGWKESSTSRDAAQRIERSGRANILRERCLDILSKQSLTPKEIAAALGVDKDSVKPRLSELLSQGKIRRTGARRDNQHELAGVL